MQLRLIEGSEAQTLLADPGFAEAWLALHVACPWASVFQHPDFAACWFASYGSRYAPLLTAGYDDAGRLAGLFALAIDSASGSPVHVGAHQAEYQVWLARDEESSHLFVARSLALLKQRFPNGALRLRYLPAQAPVASLRQGKHALGCQWRMHRQPLIRLDDHEGLEARLRKKSNKSRVKRLERAAGAPLVAEDAATAEELAVWIDRIAGDYDHRQNLANGVRPFADDPAKRQFHLDLAKAGLLHGFLFRAGKNLAAAILSMRDGDRLVVAVFAHSPALDEHSPGKFAMYRLALGAGQQGYSTIDLTPGGDWKDRFATHAGEVWEVTIRFSAFAALIGRAVELATAAAKRLLGLFGLTPARLRSLAGAAK